MDMGSGDFSHLSSDRYFSCFEGCCLLLVGFFQVGFVEVREWFSLLSLIRPFYVIYRYLLNPFLS